MWPRGGLYLLLSLQELPAYPRLPPPRHLPARPDGVPGAGLQVGAGEPGEVLQLQHRALQPQPLQLQRLQQGEETPGRLQAELCLPLPASVRERAGGGWWGA